jgi:hypothetical protein
MDRFAARFLAGAGLDWAVPCWTDFPDPHPPVQGELL